MLLSNDAEQNVSNNHGRAVTLLFFRVLFFLLLSVSENRMCGHTQAGVVISVLQVRRSQPQAEANAG